ncbi:hypothetical protein M758_2G145000 [Ceratodon purpureus]|nr:hypothetical protein M758_2G145000 [Ceratodon purpureus]
MFAKWRICCGKTVWFIEPILPDKEHRATDARKRFAANSQNLSSVPGTRMTASHNFGSQGSEPVRRPDQAQPAAGGGGRLGGARAGVRTASGQSCKHGMHGRAHSRPSPRSTWKAERTQQAGKPQTAVKLWPPVERRHCNPAKLPPLDAPHMRASRSVPRLTSHAGIG